MKKSKSGFSVILTAIAVVAIAGFTALVIWAYNSKKTESEAIDNESPWGYIAGNEQNGDIGDNYIGNKDSDVLLFEYADYQCPGCSSSFPLVHKIINDYKDRIGYIYRSYLLSYHQNANASAAAANAAALQGYWETYATTLFDKQSEWEDLTDVDARNAKFVEYFTTVSDGKGDKDKFLKDMNSDAVKTKISFDVAIAKRIKINATPTIYVYKKGQESGTEIKITGTQSDFEKSMRDTLDKALAD